MKIDRLRLSTFRNYRQIDLHFDPGIHLLLGDNAQGKTNLLEAIYMAALGKSFRAGHDDEMIQWGSLSSRIEIDFSDQIAQQNLLFILTAESQRENLYNGQSCKRKDIVGTVKAVLFCPEDLYLVKGTPANRRRFLDFFLSQVDKNYYRCLLKFNRTLLQRNNLLKKIADGQYREQLLDVWDEQLGVLAGIIVRRRREMAIEMSELANKRYFRIAGGAEVFSAHYFVSHSDADETALIETDYDEWYRRKLKTSRRKDIVRGMTHIGPQRDDLCMYIDQHEGKIFSSQGQQRSAVLALKLAEIDLIYRETGEYPILLLDDVMSELDQKRRQNLLEEIDGKIQTFITGTDKINSIDQVTKSRYYVQAGSIQKMAEE